LDRANAVKETLVAQGVAADRISTAGYGQDRPVASNDTEAGRAQNRRLELNVTSK
jgi:outer membrane protein OmpA-like peptidoglycan-associated protein